MALSLNENPFPPLPSVQAAMARAARAANRYPEFLPVELRAVIADHMGVAHERIVIGAGATGVIMQALRALTSPGDRIVLAYPTFDGYPIFAQIASLICVPVPLADDGHHDLDAMARAAVGARVVVLCRPHNPTGTLESEAKLRRFLMRIPRDTVVLLDEAYVEFVEPNDRIDVEKLIDDFPNVLAVRTFSKAYGLAGIRTGYGCCAPHVARALWTTQLPFGSSVTSLAAVVASYRSQRQLEQRIRAVVDERGYLQACLRALGVSCTESHANYLYVPNGVTSAERMYAQAGVRVRGYADGGVRITVGTRQSSRAVLSALAAGVA
ncbi:aminotransferase class I/II-fold pyridoxal phosphate-dependent enzyme [Mycobacterium sp. ACS4331]|uniref:pyridoxal phosphate-dependent aminotransferase n=1 Tax=Mycobacterium sp. ACS4331 TaxID=1834121 RepID=UPI0009ED98BB|nr:aminotransferase class I/II-fold pyridoxal phosphate-dependent enzyme [Mycobacterium sp. ACS4331]